MLEKCHKYALAINAKGKPFPTEPRDSQSLTQIIHTIAHMA
jgi:hypothetical protein